MKNYRSVLAAAVTGLVLVSGNVAFGTVVSGPTQDVLTPSTAGSVGLTVSIHSQFKRFTDDITIIWNLLSAKATGVGYVETTTNPDVYRVTTIYGDDVTPDGSAWGAGSVRGLDPTSPDFTITGGDQGEHIYGVDGLTYTSSVRESPSKASLGISDPDFDLSPFADSPNGLIAFRTFLPASAVPEPASLALLAGSGMLLTLRRRRRA